MAEIAIDSYDWGNVNSPWICADQSIWKLLIDNCSPQRYKAKSALFSQGESFKNAFIITEGRVCISVFNSDGKEKQLYIACPGAMIGEVSCILSTTHSMTATAIIPTTAYVIPSKQLQKLFHSDLLLADLMLQYEARKNQLLISQQSSLTFDSAETRIAKHLLCLCDTYGTVGKNGIRIGIRITCSDLAGIVGTSRVTVNNTITEFRQNKWIDKIDGYYHVTDIDALTDMAAETISF